MGLDSCIAPYLGQKFVSVRNYSHFGKELPKFPFERVNISHKNETYRYNSR